jgi:hypothetical protein
MGASRYTSPAIRHNATHGRPFTAFDRARSLSLAEAVGITPEMVAADLGVTVDVITSLRETRRAFGPTQEPLTLKHSVAQFMRGKTLSVKQRDANVKLDGMRPIYHVNQLILLIESDMVEWTDEFEARLAVLADLIRSRI